MNKIPIGIIALLISISAVAEHHDAAGAEVRDAVTAFNVAYATNDVEAYFGHYIEDATLYFYGSRHKVSAYHEEWAAMIEAGGGVEKNDISDLKVQVMPGGDVAVATYFADNRLRAPDGEVTAAKGFETDVWQKIDGEWKVVSLHYSEVLP